MSLKKILSVCAVYMGMSGSLSAYTLTTSKELYAPIVADDIVTMIPLRPASVISPANNSTINGTLTLTFSSGSGVQKRYIRVYYSDRAHLALAKWLGSDQTRLSVSLPKDGKYVDVELYSYIADKYFVKKYKFKQSIDPTAIVSPLIGTKLESAVLPLQWNAVSSVARRYLYVGTKGYDSGDIFKGNVTGSSISIYGLPRDGERVYVKLLTLIGGKWHARSYWFDATDAKTRTIRFVSAYLSNNTTTMRRIAPKPLIDKLKRNDAKVRRFFKNIKSYHKLLYFHDFKAMVIAKTKDGKEVVLYLAWDGQRWVLSAVS